MADEDRTGIDWVTGRIISGWQHCEQSLRIIVTTAIGSIPLMRHFGSGGKSMQDRTPHPQNVMRLYTLTAEAVRKFEPGYRLEGISLSRAGPDGVYRFDMAGTFYPRGHLGDYSIAERRATAVGLGRLGIT